MLNNSASHYLTGSCAKSLSIFSTSSWINLPRSSLSCLLRSWALLYSNWDWALNWQSKYISVACPLSHKYIFHVSKRVFTKPCKCIIRSDVSVCNVISVTTGVRWSVLLVDRGQICLQRRRSSVSPLWEPPSAAGFLQLSPGLCLHPLYPLWVRETYVISLTFLLIEVWHILYITANHYAYCRLRRQPLIFIMFLSCFIFFST